MGPIHQCEWVYCIVAIQHPHWPPPLHSQHPEGELVSLWFALWCRVSLDDIGALLLKGKPLEIADEVLTDVTAAGDGEQGVSSAGGEGDAEDGSSDDDSGESEQGVAEEEDDDEDDTDEEDEEEDD